MSLLFDSGLVSTTSGADAFVYNPIIATGSVIWVDSVNGNDSNAGTQDLPLQSLTQAITNATANNGDIILVKSGHTKTVSSTITVNKAGLKIFGIGSSNSAPNFTLAAATDAITVSAANVEINNFYFPVGTTAVNSARINIDAANVKIKGCTFLCGADDLDTITITANGLYAIIDSCSFSVSASGPSHGISIESALAVGVRIKSCSFDGGSYNWSGAAISSTVAHTGFAYDTVTLTNRAAIIHTAAAKGWATNIIVGDNCQVRI